MLQPRWGALHKAPPGLRAAADVGDEGRARQALRATTGVATAVAGGGPAQGGEALADAAVSIEGDRDHARRLSPCVCACLQACDTLAEATTTASVRNHGEGASILSVA
jgi:hypothetical protein